MRVLERVQDEKEGPLPTLFGQVQQFVQGEVGIGRNARDHSLMIHIAGHLVHSMAVHPGDRDTPFVAQLEDCLDNVPLGYALGEDHLLHGTTLRA